MTRIFAALTALATPSLAAPGGGAFNTFIAPHSREAQAARI